MAVTLTAEDFSKLCQQHFSSEYLKYTDIKLNNFAATIQRYPALWRLFMDLGDILMKEFGATSQLSEQRQLIPRILMTHAHAEFWLAAELAFSTCIHEAYSLMRGAVEPAVFAFKMFKEPSLVTMWISRRESEGAQKEFRRHFREDRKKNLFTGIPGLAKLHKYWVDWSEISAHSNMDDMARRTQMDVGKDAVNFAVHYFERDQRYVCLAAFQILEAMALIEPLLHTMFEGRLRLHPEVFRSIYDFGTCL